MLRIVKSDMPENWQGEAPDREAEIIPDDMAYFDLHPNDMPAFFAQAGLIEGCLERLASIFWFDGEMVLKITKGEYRLEGFISLYEEDPCLDEETIHFKKEIERIESEAKKLAHDFRADSYSVGFKLVATFQVKEKEASFSQH